MASPSITTRQLRISTPSSIPLSSDSDSSLEEQTPSASIIRFSFFVPAPVLKQAIAGLSDPDLNPDGLGLMEVCDSGFELTAYQNDEVHGKVFGFLSLKASGLGDFVCVSPTVMVISLIDVQNSLEAKKPADSDRVKVFSLSESDRVCFSFPSKFFDTPFCGNDEGQFSKFPIFSYGFEMPIPRKKIEDVLDNILKMLPRRRPHPVSMKIATSVGMRMGNFEVKVDKTEIVWALFPYWESLSKTLRLSKGCTLWLASFPGQIVVLRFDLKELGVFMYLKYASEFFMKKDLPTIGTYRPLNPRHPC